MKLLSYFCNHSGIFPQLAQISMSRDRKNFNTVFHLLFFFFLIIFSGITAVAQEGEALFKANCGNCHKPDADFTGPALKGWSQRVPPGEWVHEWVHNPGKKIGSDPYATALQAKWKTVMTAFPQLENKQIDAILAYVDSYTPPVAAATSTGTTDSGENDNSLLFGILTLVLALVAFILLQVNSNLRKLTDEKEGIFRGEPVPFYRNKTYLMIGILLLAGLGGYFTVEAMVGLGRNKSYQPVQPIYYSHKVHAGTNQISCLYCHGGAQDSKHANIPSVNICMNCHIAIKDYKGESLTREDGRSVNGTAEIQKLYQYAGWNPEKKAYNPDNNGDGMPDGSKPIQWVKIHNLPDHVYFNHSQHIKVGKQQCQTCHGNIQDMPEVYQFADLSMGWCINCHRETKVDFVDGKTGEGNKFYSMYEKFHNDIKNKRLDSITVEHLGGTECQKCHY
ncbi:MAG: c-type cytochrome [Ferruginibacter sp.]